MSKAPNYLGISKNPIPTKQEILDEMELHNNDEAGKISPWTFEDTEYHLLLSDRYHKL